MLGSFLDSFPVQLSPDESEASKYLVFVFEVAWQAHITLVTVEEVLSATDPADPASYAVVLFLVLIVHEPALCAEILKPNVELDRNNLSLRPRSFGETYLAEDDPTP